MTIYTYFTPPPPFTPSSPQTLPHPHPPAPHRPSAPSQHSSHTPSPGQKTVRNPTIYPLHPASLPISSSHHHLARRVRNQTRADRGKGTICADGWSGWSSWRRGRRLRGGFVRLIGVRLGGRVGMVVGRWYHRCDQKIYLPSDNFPSRNHLSGASSAQVANGGYGTSGGGARGCSLGVNGCRGDGGGFSALYVNSERKGRIVGVETYVLESLMEF